MELKQNLSDLYIVADKLLIVPYGIETRFRVLCFRIVPTFNRTLWN